MLGVDRPLHGPEQRQPGQVGCALTTRLRSRETHRRGVGHGAVAQRDTGVRAGDQRPAWLDDVEAWAALLAHSLSEVSSAVANAITQIEMLFDLAAWQIIFSRWT